MELFTLFGVLAVGSVMFWGFWVSAFVLFCILVGLTETEHQGWAAVLLVGGFIAMGSTGIFNLYDYSTGHKWALFKLVVEFIAIGVAWGTVKWVIHVKKAKRAYYKSRDGFLKNRGVTEFTDALRIEWTKKLVYDADRGAAIDGQPPLAKENKEKIITWMSLWPWSMAGTVLYDLLKEVWEWLYEAVAGLFDSISKSMFKDVSADFASKEALEAAAEADSAAKKSERMARNNY